MFVTLILLTSCNYNNQKTQNNKTSDEVHDFNESKSMAYPTKLSNNKIAGLYSGTDNVGMESTLILKGGGHLITQSSIGDGGPAYGHWMGDAEDVTLYLNSEYGRDQMLGHAKITEGGLQIVGGNFYNRK